MDTSAFIGINPVLHASPRAAWLFALVKSRFDGARRKPERCALPGQYVVVRLQRPDGGPSVALSPLYSGELQTI